MDREKLFRRVLDLYYGQDEWCTKSSLEFKHGIYSLEFKQPRRRIYDNMSFTLSQQQGQTSVFVQNSCIASNDKSTEIAKAEMFLDGSMCINMPKIYSADTPDGNRYPVTSGQFRCRHCSNSEFKSAVEQVRRGVCSSRVSDWLIGHEEIQYYLALPCLVDLLLCTNKHCRRYNFVTPSFDYHVPHSIKLIKYLKVSDSGIGARDIETARSGLCEAMELCMPMPIVDQIIDYSLPRPGSFVNATPAPLTDASALAPCLRWKVCELDESGCIIGVDDGASRLLQRFPLGPRSSYQFTDGQYLVTHEDANP